MIEEYSGVLAKKQEFSVSLKRAKEKLQSVLKLMEFPKSQEEFDRILDLLSGCEIVDKDIMKATLHFDNPYKSMSMDLDSSILNCSLLDVSHNPLKAEDASHTTSDSINGVSESALLENMKNINLILGHSTSPPSEDFVESMVAMLLESPLFTKKEKVPRYGEKLAELETVLKSFSKMDVLMNSNLSFKKSPLEGIKEVESEDEDEEKIKADMVKKEVEVKHTMTVSEIIKKETPFDVFEKKLLDLKKKFYSCQEIEDKDSKSFLEGIEGLSASFVEFSLSENIKLGNHISEFFKNSKEKVSKLSKNSYLRLSELMNSKFLELEKLIMPKLDSIKKGEEFDEVDPEFGDISQIDLGALGEPLETEENEEVDSKNVSTVKILNDIQDGENHVDLTPEKKEMINFKKSPIVKKIQKKQKSNASSENTEFQKEEEDNINKKVEAKDLIHLKNEDDEHSKEVEEIADNLYNSDILQQNNSYEDIQSDPLDYSRILSNSMFLDDQGSNRQTDILNKTVSIMPTADPTKFTLTNYSWMTKNLITGVSNLPFFKPEDDNGDKNKE